MSYKLAVNGAKSIRTKPFPSRIFHGKEAIKKELCDLIDSERLSGYRGSWGQHFFGGQKVKELELYFENICNHEIKALAVNSCTSALIIACGAIGLKNGDEVIVTPWSMTCSATAPMFYGAKPVFADIDPETYCLDAESVESKITKKTKAIIVVDLFGHPYDVKINEIAKKHGLYIIEDCAQAMGATYNNHHVGTLADIGCFSFTQGKHFTCGEGGMITTANEELYIKCALIRNHAESVINSIPNEKIRNEYAGWDNMVGFNMRLTELQAVVLLEQLYHLRDEMINRTFVVQQLSKRIDLSGIKIAKVKAGCSHTYYVLGFNYDENIVGVPRDRFVEALKAELTIETTNAGITTKNEALFWNGYIKPLYKMPLFQKKGYKVKLPVVERLQDKEFFFTTYQSLPLTYEDINDIALAFNKVYENKEELI